MRVTGGALGGRKLGSVPPGVRPTSDRVREALFARLGSCESCRVLDLFAGTGALGIEALSRGAESVIFVERVARVASVLWSNLEALALVGRSELLRGDARRVLRRQRMGARRFDLVLVDPPYASGDAAAALGLLVERQLLADDATVVVERSRRHHLEAVPGLVALDERRYGDTVLVFLKAGSCEAAAPGVRRPQGGCDLA